MAVTGYSANMDWGLWQTWQKLENLQDMAVTGYSADIDWRIWQTRQKLENLQTWQWLVTEYKVNFSPYTSTIPTWLLAALSINEHLCRSAWS
jgi:hypothetical protein